jgi:hypothetical protein
MQATFCSIFAYRTIQDIQNIAVGSLDCFIDFGAHRLCQTTSLLSINSSLFLLMAQALCTRILAPGKSIFVNASVRYCAASLRLCNAFEISCSVHRNAHALQIFDNDMSNAAVFSTTQCVELASIVGEVAVHSNGIQAAQLYQDSSL